MPSIKEIKTYLNNEIKLSLKTRLYRFFGIYIAKILLYTPITANQVTFLTGVLAFIIAILFSFGKFWYSIIALILLFLQLNLDHVDGLIARYRKTISVRGVFIDLIIHSITASLVFFGLTLGVYRNTNDFMFLFFGMSAVLFSHLSSSVHHLKSQGLVIRLIQYSKGKYLEELEDKKLEIIDTEAKKRMSFWKKIIKKILMLLTFSHVPFILIFSIIFNFTQWVLVFYGIALPLKWLIVVFYEFKMDYKSLEYLFKPYKLK